MGSVAATDARRGSFRASPMVASVLARTDMDRQILEMTESIYIEDSGAAMMELAELRRLGIRIALDDFGCGYSSLSYLGRLPIDIVKIDRGFITDIGDVPTSRAIVEAVTKLAHVLGLSVVAEGVETQDQSDQVSAIGCQFFQGFFHARPMSASAIGARLDALSNPRATKCSARDGGGGTNRTEADSQSGFRWSCRRPSGRGRRGRVRRRGRR